MQITKEMLETRLKALRDDYINLTNTLNATDGAIQDCTFWLEQLAKESAKDIPQEALKEEKKKQ